MFVTGPCVEDAAASVRPVSSMLLRIDVDDAADDEMMIKQTVQENVACERVGWLK